MVFEDPEGRSYMLLRFAACCYIQRGNQGSGTSKKIKQRQQLSYKHVVYLRSPITALPRPPHTHRVSLGIKRDIT